MLLALLLAPLAAQRRVVGEVARWLLDLACELVLDAHHGLLSRSALTARTYPTAGGRNDV
jgi:hypothetical protein